MNIFKHNLLFLKQRIRLRSNDDGATAIEFALIAPILFVLMIGIMELGLIMFANNVIENATNAAARFGITGSDYAGGSTVGVNNSGPAPLDREQVIRDYIKQNAGRLLDPNRLSISCESLGKSFGSVKTNQVTNPGTAGADGSSTTSSCNATGLGSGDDAVIYNVKYYWKIFTPIIGNIQLFSGNNVIIQSSMVVKNEAF